MHHFKTASAVIVVFLVFRAFSTLANRGGGSNCSCGSRCSSAPGMEFSPPA